MEVVFNSVKFKKAKNELVFSLKEGKTYGLIGSSGSNKTKILELISGIELPASGSACVCGYDINKDTKDEVLYKVRKNVGYLFENTIEQFFQETVYDEIAFALKNYEYKSENIDDHIKKSLKLVGLDESYLDRNPFSLSCGEAKKVALATIVAYNPKVVLLDDPTLGLDYKSKKDLIKLIRVLKKRYKKTIIVASKDVEFLHKIVDDIIVINNNKVVLSGTKYNVFSNKALLSKLGFEIPKIIEFSDLVKDKKNIKLGYRDEMNDLMKDIYRNV